jgi:hypothetical protein
MRASFENMQRGDVVSKRGGSGFNRGRAPAAGTISLKTAMLCVRPPGACCCVNAAHRKMPLERRKLPNPSI